MTENPGFTFAVRLLFVLLAADVDLDQVVRLGWTGLLTVAALMFLVRPAAVMLSTIGTELPLRHNGLKERTLRTADAPSKAGFMVLTSEEQAVRRLRAHTRL